MACIPEHLDPPAYIPASDCFADASCETQVYPVFATCRRPVPLFIHLGSTLASSSRADDFALLEPLDGEVFELFDNGKSEPSELPEAYKAYVIEETIPVETLA